MKIFLSPSDQTYNKYTGVSTNESTQCVKIAKAAKKYLDINGYTTKVGDVKDGIKGRVKESNSWGADVHVCIHTNAGGGDGTLVMCYKGRTKNKYVKNVYVNVAAVSPGKDDGIKVNTGLYEINHTKALCVYVECEFHDDKTLAKWIRKNSDKLGKAIAQGFCAADGKNFKTGESSVSSGGTVYKVQCGAFSKSANATALGKKLNANGFSVYIYRSSDGLYKVQTGAYSKKSNAESQVKKLKAKGFDAYYYKS